MASEEALFALYPIHWLVSQNKPDQLCNLLEKREHDLETTDPRGRTALNLAVLLNRMECIELLLAFGASPLSESRAGWTILHDAISNHANTGHCNLDLLKMIATAEQSARRKTLQVRKEEMTLICLLFFSLL